MPSIPCNFARHKFLESCVKNQHKSVGSMAPSRAWRLHKKNKPHGAQHGVAAVQSAPGSSNSHKAKSRLI